MKDFLSFCFLDFSQSTAVMATNIVGFLLLTKHRHVRECKFDYLMLTFYTLHQGVKLFELYSSYKGVLDSVTSQGR